MNLLSWILSLPKKANIPIEKSSQTAKAADGGAMSIVGQSKYPLQVQVLGCRVPITITLGKVTVIHNLGCPVLIGQPAKISNEIVTLPHKHKLTLKDIHGIEHTISYPLPPPKEMFVYETLKSPNLQILYPGENLTFKLSNQFSNCKMISFTPRPDFLLTPAFIKVDGNLNISISSASSFPITIPKHAHVGDVRSAIDYETAHISRLYTIDDSTFEAYNPTVEWDRSKCFVNDVQIDPDKIMTEDWKQKFTQLCTNYSDIIQYNPGTYNGYYGFVSNTIEFTSTPPPNNKAYVPRYSKEMTDKLANKMDELLELGVLVKPEDIGCTPMFVSPSMLIPKPGSKDYRFVTDFSNLNNFIRKMPTISPGIEETKLALSKFKYVCTIDLSQFYFQNKVNSHDSQYLGVIHPYKGTLVYSVSPMGLRGSGEIDYERLTRIFGDLQKEEKLCRQADALIVGGKQTLAELFSNLAEVFHRLRTCNLTIKPSKLVIAPRKVELFGWEYSNQGWNPTAHTINPLSVAPKPKTVKQLRSWLGAAKQISPCLEDYAVHFSPLEQVVATNRKSQEYVNWTHELSQAFVKAQTLLGTVNTLCYPSPKDKICTFSDYSQANHAIGGRLEFTRTLEDGTVKKFHGGFFSAKVTDCQTRWNPCESEALACKLVLEHFKHVIRENENVVTHYCDNAPTVQAFNRAKQGKFSVSSRIASFLLSVSSMNVDIVHKSGKSIPATDFFSRNPIQCQNESCQICKYIAEQVFVGEHSIRQITASEIINGTLSMPYIQPSAWLTLQNRDKTIIHLKKLIASGQQPEPRKTGGENTVLKHLHSLFVKGKLKVAQNGLVTSEFTDDNGQIYSPIVVPQTLYPGLVCAIHLKLAHPTKYQMTKLLSRYFLCPGSSRMISDVVDSCHTCLSLKPLPPTLFSETTSVSDDFGSRFSADIMVRNSQHILFVVEKLTSFCFASILESENSSSIGSSLISLIGQFVSQKGCVVRTDGAAYFQKLRTEAQQEDSVWSKLGIKFELGNSLHVNKNPSAENVIKEAHDSINKLGYPGALLHADLVLVVKRINAKIRQHGYSSLELFCKRSSATGKDVVLTDSSLADKQMSTRLSSHNPPQPLSHNFSVGDLVMVKSKKDKLHPRDTYIIHDFSTENDAQWAEILKFGSKLVNKNQKVRVEDLVKVTTNVSSRPTRASATRAAEKIKALIPVLQRIETTLSSPTHAWDYHDVLDMVLRGEDEFVLNHETFNDAIEDNETLEGSDSNSEDEEATETSDSTDDSEVVFQDSQENISESNDQTLSTENELLNPNLVHDMNSFLDNPSIAAYPQHHSQVNLNTVQNLGAVLDDVFNSHSTNDGQSQRRSERTAAKTKKDYRAMHRGN